MTETAATAKQIAYLSQLRTVIGISTSKASRGLTVAEASAIIDEMKSRVEA